MSHVSHNFAHSPGARSFTKEEVSCHDSEDSIWVIYQGHIYDLTSFFNQHPGGEDVILEFAGKDITNVMKDPNFHLHSEVAFDMLKQYWVGELILDEKNISGSAARDDEKLGLQQRHGGVYANSLHSTTNSDVPFLDLTKPLFYQLWTATFSKEFYLDQVHIPRHVAHTVPCFANPFLDLLSKTPWYVIPILWVPVSLWMLFNSFDSLGVPSALLGFVGGMSLWTLIEYTLHRFLFHIDVLLPDHPYFLLAHFLFHGIHHFMPMDKLRLVFPPAMGAIMAYPVMSCYLSLFGSSYGMAIGGGTILAYVVYDLTHYFLHHSSLPLSHLQSMKSYHLKHHFSQPNAGYGVTSKVWDYVFGTMLA